MTSTLAAIRARQASQLGPTLLRIVGWPAVALAGAVAAALVAAAVDPGAELTRTRLGGLGLAASLALVFDDPASTTLASSPTSLRWRRAYHLALAGTVLAIGWVAILAAGSHPAPTGALTAELAAFVAAGLAVAALAGGIPGALSTCLLAGLSPLLAARFRWWPLPGSPMEPDAVRSLLALAALATALAVHWSRDSAIA